MRSLALPRRGKGPIPCAEMSAGACAARWHAPRATKLRLPQSVPPQNEHKSVRVDDFLGAEEAKKVVEEAIQL